MAGLSNEGLEIKRLVEVLADLRQQAQPIFQDLVPPGDVVDVGDSSTLGRLIALISVPNADLWEAVQEVYLAFDPNSARGVALDNLVMYGGLTRNPASRTTATVVIWGDENTYIPFGLNTVRALDNTLYDIALDTILSREACIGFIASVPTVVDGNVYSVTIGYGQTTFTATTTANSASTEDTILTALASQLNVYPSLVVGDDQLGMKIETVDIYVPMDVAVSGLVINKIKTRTEVQNQVVGAKEQEANTITAIATPLLGWDSVNNPFAAITGEDQETDEELRRRFRESKFLRAQNMSDALYSALLDIDGVRYVGIYENETDVYDATYDLPPHSFKPIVQGGNPQEIARVVWNNKPLGIGSEGNTTFTILDSQGFPRDIDFERPIDEEIYINLTLTTDSIAFPSDGIAQIKAALIEYFENTFSIGDDVIYSRLYTPINTIPGHQVDSMTIGLAPGSMGTSNIVIPYNGIPHLDASNINITLT